jgi:hypothetical protein
VTLHRLLFLVTEAQITDEQLLPAFGRSFCAWLTARSLHPTPATGVGLRVRHILLTPYPSAGCKPVNSTEDRRDPSSDAKTGIVAALPHVGRRMTVATDVKDLPADGSAPSAPTGDAPTKAEITSAAADVETLDGLKTKLKEAETKLRQSEDPKRVEFWQSKADKLENQIKEVNTRLEGVGPKWLSFIREGAARNMTAAQLLEHLEKQAKENVGATTQSKASRTDALELILAENRAGHSGFAAYLSEELDLGTPVTAATIETHRARYTRLNPEGSRPQATSAAPAKADDEKPHPPRVAGGSGAPSKGKGPAWQPGKKGVDLIAQGLRGE